MNIEIEKYLEELALEQLANHKEGSFLEKAMSIYDKLQDNIIALVEKDEDSGILKMKVITVMTFTILKKLGKGKKTTEFDKQDWKDVMESVSKYAILQNETDYVRSIFGIYEKYIRASADCIEAYTSEKKVMEIRFLADEICMKTQLLESEQITEVLYIEQCLWIALEAMIKLLATTVSKIANEEYSDLAYALAAYAFEYGRMSLYKREQEIVNEFIQSQNQLDVELEEKYKKFISDLRSQMEQFYVLIDNAFVPDFRERFRGSIILAKEFGIEEQDILMDIDDIDAFFED